MNLRRDQWQGFDNAGRPSFSYPEVRDLAGQRDLFASVAGWVRHAVALDVGDGDGREAQVQFVAVVPAVGSQRYGLGWWVEEDRFGYRSLLAQGGTDASSVWLRLVPSERIAVVMLANKGVGLCCRPANVAWRPRKSHPAICPAACEGAVEPALGRTENPSRRLVKVNVQSVTPSSEDQHN